MNINTLKFIRNYRGLNNADIARLSGVSRQRVFQWFDSDQTEYVNIKSINLAQLSKQLGVSADFLLKEIPGLAEIQFVQTEFLWDELYPNLESFFRALVTFQHRAVARLIEIIGLFKAQRALGNQVWSDFNEYKKYIPPKRREGLERIWQLQKNLDMI